MGMKMMWMDAMTPVGAYTLGEDPPLSTVHVLLLAMTLFLSLQ